MFLRRCAIWFSIGFLTPLSIFPFIRKLSLILPMTRGSPSLKMDRLMMSFADYSQVCPLWDTLESMIGLRLRLPGVYLSLWWLRMRSKNENLVVGVVSSSVWCSVAASMNKLINSTAKQILNTNPRLIPSKIEGRYLIEAISYLFTSALTFSNSLEIWYQ